MICEYFNSPEDIAKIYFQGDRRAYHAQFLSKKTIPLTSAFSQSKSGKDEEKYSLRSAENYLRYLGYDNRKIAILNVDVQEVINLHLSMLEVDPAKIERSNNFYLGIRIDGKPVSPESDLAKNMEDEFIRRFELRLQLKERSNSMLITSRHEVPRPMLQA